MPVDVAAGCAEGHADAELLRAAADGVVEGAVDAEKREQEGGDAEAGEEVRLQPLGGEGVGELVVEGRSLRCDGAPGS